MAKYGRFRLLVENILYKAGVDSLSGNVKYFAELNNTHIEEIEYFRPDGKNYPPSGVAFYNGEIWKQIRKNLRSFHEAIADDQGALSRYKGGSITFATTVNTVIDMQKGNKFMKALKKAFYSFKNKLFTNKYLNKIFKNLNAEFQNTDDFEIGSVSIGNFFTGKYVTKDEVYNDTSISVTVGGIPSELLLMLATEICAQFKQHTVLVHDLNTNRIFLVDSKGITGKNPKAKIANATKELKKLHNINSQAK